MQNFKQNTLIAREMNNFRLTSETYSKLLTSLKVMISEKN